MSEWLLFNANSAIFQLYHGDNQSLLFLLNAVCLLEKHQIPILVFDLIQPGLELTIYRTRDEHANYYTTDAVFICMWNHVFIFEFQCKLWLIYFLFNYNLFFS